MKEKKNKRKAALLFIGLLVFNSLIAYFFLKAGNQTTNRKSTDEDYIAYLKLMSKETNYAIGKEYTDTIVVKDEDIKNDESIIQSFDGLSLSFLHEGKHYITFSSNKYTEKAMSDLNDKGINVYRNPVAKIKEGNEKELISVCEQALQSKPKGIKVVMIDTGAHGLTGINLTHEEDGDYNGHGTRIRRMIKKACKDKAKIISVKAVNHKGYSSELLLTEAVKLALKENPDIISMPIVFESGVKTSQLNEEIKKAEEKKILLVTR